jgi:Dinucleotide-utilizing enzymes involved in molybdopterin and thiamine biosynthesis family 1
MIVGHRVLSRNLAAILLMQMRKKSPKQVVFNIRDLTRTTRTPFTAKTRRNVQKREFSCPKRGVFCVASLLSEWRGWFQPVNRMKPLFLPELP